MRAERLTEVITGHGESPVWWPDGSGLRLVGGDAGDVLWLAADGIRRTPIGDFAAFVRPSLPGDFVAGTRDSIALVDGEERQILTTLPIRQGMRLNDGGTDRFGNLYFGSMAYNIDTHPSAGSLWRYTDAPVRVADGITISNGFDTTPDGATAFYIDTMTRRIDRWDVTETGLQGRRLFVDLSDHEGLPDGLTVASDSSVWVAMWGGSAVLGFDAEGHQIERIDVAAPQTTACAFGGDDLQTLFITTSSQGLTPDGIAGSVFTARPSATGVQVQPFALARS